MTLNELLTELNPDACATYDIVSRCFHEDFEDDAMNEPVREVGLLLNRAERQRLKGAGSIQEACAIESNTSELSHQDTIEAEALAILGTDSVKSPYPYSQAAAWTAADTNDTTWNDDAKISFAQLMHPNEPFLEDSFSTLDDLEVSRKGPDDFLGYSTRTASDEDFAIYDDLEADNVQNSRGIQRDDFAFDNNFLNSNHFDTPQQSDIFLELSTNVPTVLSQPVRLQGTENVANQISPMDDSTSESRLETNPTARSSGSAFNPSSVGLLCDQSSVNTSLFFAMRRGNTAPVGLLFSPSSRTSNEVEGLAEAPPSRNSISSTMSKFPPSEILDDPTYLKPPSTWVSPPDSTVYMISLDTIQKRALMNGLESELCNIRPFQRYTLTTVDIIVNPDSGIIYFPLSALPSQCDAIASRACKASWHFDRIVVVFEAFPSSLCYKSTMGEKATPFAYGPPVLKAIKRFRRDLSLREGLGERNRNCEIQLAFANSVREAAILSRMIADDLTAGSANAGYMPTEEELEVSLLCAYNDMQGSLKVFVFQGEDELGSMIGINAFAANIILRHCTLYDFLEMSEEDRRAAFGILIGRSRIVRPLSNSLFSCQKHDYIIRRIIATPS